MFALMEKIIGFVGGILIGVLIGVLAALISIGSGHSRIISHDYKCTKTEIVGESPNREEMCTQFTMEKKP